MRLPRKLLRINALLALALLAFVFGEPLYAFRMIQNFATGRVTGGSLVTCDDPGGFTHWNQANIAWFHNPANQGAGREGALQAAMASWTNVAGADHVLSYAGNTGAGFVTDGVNTLVWLAGRECTGNCLGLTALVLQGGQAIVETDVVFNDAVTWRDDGSDYDVQSVAAHELGHTLGIHHTELAGAPRPTMYFQYFGTGGRSLEGDDRAALQCSQNRYGTGPPPPPAGEPPPPPAGEPPPPPGTCGHNLQCYPSLHQCAAECCGVCERRINCGGATAHKCFEP